VRCPNCGYEKPVKGKPRSDPENRYFHGVILPILAEYTGYTIDECKDLVKSMFLKSEIMLRTKDGYQEVSTVRGSSRLSTAEFEKFMSDIRTWASQTLGIYVPEPNEVNCEA
jgi:hypothetical protein